jgi:rhodanese-related sulfurtransferase
LDSVENFELANMLFQQPDTRSDVLIVDVRGRDFAGGHIPSSINMRTSEVLKQPGHLIASARAQEVHQIIFTCMYSVLRARKCVTALQQYQTMEQKSNHAPYRIRISILTGGFHGWMNAFGHIPEGTKTVELRDPKYVDDFDPRSWSNCGPNAGGLVHVMDALWTEGGQQALSDALFAELGKLSEAQERSSADSVEDENKQTQRLIADVDDASQLPGVVNMDVSEPKNDANDESDGKDSSIPISSNNNMFGGLGDLAAMIPGGGKSKRAMTPEP